MSDRRVQKVLDFGEWARELEASQERVEALRLARAIALAALPRRSRKGQRDLTRTIRLGRTAWVSVTYSVEKGARLPFGEDRFVLAGVLHLAVSQGGPLVTMESAGELLELFDIERNDLGYQRLRERFQRLSSLAIALRFGSCRQDVGRIRGEQSFLFRSYCLPSQEELGEMSRQLPLLSEAELQLVRRRDVTYWVRLSEEVWGYVRDPKNLFWVPVDLLKLFVDNPTAWDWAVFLTARCGAARSESKVPHEALVDLFRDGSEPDRKVIYRLRKAHDLVQEATGGRFVARFEEDGVTPTRGRPRKNWCLVVGPSEPLMQPRRAIPA